MRGIAKLLFGDDADRLLDRFCGDEADGFGLADRVRRSGEWCGTTPGRGPADTAYGRARPGGARPGGLRREVIVRKYHPR